MSSGPALPLDGSGDGGAQISRLMSQKEKVRADIVGPLHPPYPSLLLHEAYLTRSQQHRLVSHGVIRSNPRYPSDPGASTLHAHAACTHDDDVWSSEISTGCESPPLNKYYLCSSLAITPALTRECTLYTVHIHVSVQREPEPGRR